MKNSKRDLLTVKTAAENKKKKIACSNCQLKKKNKILCVVCRTSDSCVYNTLTGAVVTPLGPNISLLVIEKIKIKLANVNYSILSGFEFKNNNTHMRSKKKSKTLFQI